MDKVFWRYNEELFSRGMAKQGTEYELLIKQIYEQIHKEEGYTNINVHHNIKLRGEKSGQLHQIDVYWEFKIAQVVYKIAIECKDYSSPVSVGKIRDFITVVNDIGDIKGVFVSTSGFQSGAKQVASAYGLDLKEIRQPKASDWDGLMKSIQVKMILIASPRPSAINIFIDGKWAQNNNFNLTILNNQLKEYLLIQQESRQPIIIYDDDKNRVTDIQELCKQLPTDKEGNSLEHIASFNNGYLIINCRLIKLHSVSIIYSYFSTPIEQSFIVDGGALVKAVIKDIKTGEITFVNKK